MRINYPNSTTTKSSRNLVEATRNLSTVLKEAVPFMSELVRGTGVCSRSSQQDVYL